MPLPPSLAQWLVVQGHDAVHAGLLGLSRATDVELMRRAVQEGRTVVTADLDYPRLLALAGASAPSLILFRGGDWDDSEIIGCMSNFLAQVDEAEITQCIHVIERNRIRRRRLPIS